MESLFDHIQRQLHANKPFVAYRQPGSDELCFLSGPLEHLDPRDTEALSGFIFAPFDRTAPAYIMRPDKTDFVHLDPDQWGEVEAVPAMVRDTGQERAHTARVARAVASLQKKELEKVVLSRRLEVAHDLQPWQAFRNLLQWYDDAFCYLWHAPETGTWAGATPEVLGKWEAGTFSTMSLAGTQPYQGSYQVSWGAKEQEEQEVVTRYLQEKLSPRLKHMDLVGPETARAGELLHLRSTIYGQLPAGEYLDLLMALHPTPAICGNPMEKALEYIRGAEDYAREFYTGFLGPYRVFGSEKACTYVNLRCMKMLGKKAWVYVGGGITEDSDPQAEFQETRAKAGTMIRALSVRSL